jgi:GxxExxY protein
MTLSKKYIDQLTYQIIGCAIEVHKVLGPGLLESVYEKCFMHELGLRGLHCKSQRKVPIQYKGVSMDADLRYDVLVEDLIIVEIKACEAIVPIFDAIVLSYMEMTEKPKGIILNFHCLNIFREGQRTLVNKIYAALPDE